MTEFKYPKVSVVIPMYNEREMIPHCIESLQAQDYPKDRIEIVVVNGASTDGSESVVQEAMVTDSRIVLYENPKRKTPGSLNVGIRKSTGEVIIILGAHTTVQKDFIRQNIEYMQIMNVPCVGGTQKNIGKTYMQNAIAIAMGSCFGIPSAPYRYLKKERYVDTVVYAAYKKELFEEIGYFDEEILISEDAELNWRIRQAGHKIFYTPKIVSYYYPRKTLRSFVKQLYRYGILRVNVILKHRDAIKLIHLIPMIFLLGTLALLALGIFNTVFTKVLFIIALTYIGLVLIASVIESTANSFKYFPVMLLIFPSLHISWGLGFIAGLFVRRS